MLGSCAFCGHESVDEPPENVGVAERNIEKSKEDRKFQKAWDDFKNNKTSSAPINPRTGKVFQNKRHCSKKEQIILQ